MMLEPPASLVLVHGAGSGPWVFDGWAPDFPDVRVHAVDLHAGLDVARASMRDYTDRVVESASALPRPVSLCGWSMGGLVVLQAVAHVRPHSAVLLEASPPGEVQGFAPRTTLAEGTFDPEKTYGRFPAGMCARPESLLARAERKRGISVPALECPSLVVSGDEFPADRGRALAALYGSEHLQFDGLDHWALVLDRRVHAAIVRFLGVR
jgi:pimeloyl-ACP methyl ester carboxylesterase